MMDFTGMPFPTTMPMLPGWLIKLLKAMFTHPKKKETPQDVAERQRWRREFTDYVQPNLAVDNGDLDANYFQHQPYLHLSAYGQNLFIQKKPGIMVFRVCFLLRICRANIVIKSWYVLHKFRKIISSHRCIFPAALNVFLTQQLRSNG